MAPRSIFVSHKGNRTANSIAVRDSAMQKQVSTLIETKLQQCLALQQRGRFSEAERTYQEIIQEDPTCFIAQHQLGVLALQTHQTQRGVELIAKAIDLNPNVAAAYNNLGIGLSDLKRYEEAIASYNKAITLKLDYAEAYNNRGAALRELKRLEEALASYDKAIALKPAYGDAYNNRGNALSKLQRHHEAIASYDKAILLIPDNAEAHRGRGDALLHSKDYTEAPILNEKAFLLAPKHLRVFVLNEFIALLRVKTCEKALASYDRAIALEPDYAEAYNNRGNALYELKRLVEALANYDKAITLKPHLAYVYVNRGNTLNDLKRHEEALESFDKAIALQPNFEFLLGDLIHTKMSICDWSNLETMIAQLANKINGAEKVSRPFPILAATNSPELLRKAAEIYTLARNPLNDALPKLAKHQRRNKIRIGYFSANFRNHPTSNLAAELFEKHDRSQFEITAFSFGPFTNDEMQQRVVLAFDKFIDVRYQSDEEVAILARELGIDIAVNLTGFSQGCRTNIFSMRAAPIQVNYLSYPGTMGAEYFDYLMADPILIPESNQGCFAEKIVYLPNTYQVNDSKRRISAKKLTRAEVGLPEDAFVFCCFNSNYKIVAAIFDSWMRILKRVNDSVLWLFEDNAKAASNLQKEAEIRGICAARLIFAPPTSHPDHLARHRLADLFLDTLPCNAHTTASDALWAGVPVLTQIGETFAGRVAASLLTAIGAPELITSTPEEYESLAVELATNPAKLADINHKLAENRLTTPLFDTQLITKHIEAAYIAMYERCQADLPPDHIYLAV
jgi:predicted O-linked N-acetylglucosamine transferase (SPINDLY family)